MNKYSSNVQRFFARDVYYGTINPPSDLVIAQSAWTSQLFNLHGHVNDTTKEVLNQQSKINLHSIGLYSNFADGLVFAEPGEEIFLSLNIYVVSRGAAIGGQSDFTAGDETVNGGGTTTYTVDLAGVSYIEAGGKYFKIDSITDNDNFELTRPAFWDQNNVAIYPLTVTGAVSGIPEIEIRTLNDMVPFEQFVDANAAFDYDWIFEGRVIIPTDQTTRFYTISINTDFAEKNIMFDLAADIEFTRE